MTPEELAAFRNHRLVRALDPNTIEQLSALATFAYFSPGQFLLREGEVNRFFYFIEKGRVSLEVHAPGKEVVCVETLGEGDSLGVSWFFENTRVHVDARVKEPVTVFVLDGALLRQQMQNDPPFGYAILSWLLETTFRRLERARMQRLDVYK